MLNPLDHPICLEIPHRLTPLSAWHEHIPFGMFIVDVLRPEMVVELGTHFGDSYCAFCQAVRKLKLETKCYAVDTWKGDAHTGPYGSDILADLRAHHDPLYGSFSCLLPSLFEDALPHFADNTIDLLHIDAYHTYEAVRDDFNSWLPKLSRRAVVLFHDTNVRERGFGVWKFWDEIRRDYPHFEFLHGHGLGVLAVGEDHPEEFRKFLDASREDPIGVREMFFQLGRRLTLQAQAPDVNHALRDATSVLQVFWDEDGEYTEANSVTERLIPDGAVHEYSLQIPAKAGGQFRFDPVNSPAYVEIRRIALYARAADGGEEDSLLARWSTEDGFSGLQVGDGMMRLRGEEVYKLVCISTDPQILLDSRTQPTGDSPLLLKVLMSVSWDSQKPLLAELAKVHRQLQSYETLKASQQSEIESLRAVLQAMEADSAATRSQLKGAREQLRTQEILKGEHLAELEKLREALRAVETERDARLSETESLRAELRTLEANSATKEAENAANLSRLESAREKLRQQEAEREQSLSELRRLREASTAQETLKTRHLAEIEKLRQELSDRETQIAANLKQLKELREQIQVQEGMKASYLSELRVQESVHSGEVKQLREEISDAEKRLAAQAGELTDLTARLTEMQAELAKKEKQLAKTEAQLHDIANSRLWKVLSPIHGSKTPDR